MWYPLIIYGWSKNYVTDPLFRNTASSVMKGNRRNTQAHEVRVRNITRFYDDIRRTTRQYYPLRLPE